MANVTWDAATVIAVTISGAGLVATNTGTNSSNQGAHAVFTEAKSSGKYYFEITLTTFTAGFNVSLGVGSTTATYIGLGDSLATGGAMCTAINGGVYANGADTGVVIGGRAGLTTGIALDVDNRRIWFRPSAAGTWNNSGTANPATNTGGFTIPSGGMVPFTVFGGFTGNSGNVMTANFGDTAFTGAVPSGFTAGFPVGSGAVVAQARAMVLA